ncbi:MAG: hypothetical protein M1528_02450 [Candidatus Marsarchaeota archaeon]|jgi:hypothetical protein|nr:hypothetical protein [Candidatus Marsarchaeota archaeon]MCL5115369.1 hypothetical protein [Candidatus Marsarchaeota archaeon]
MSEKGFSLTKERESTILNSVHGNFSVLGEEYYLKGSSRLSFLAAEFFRLSFMSYAGNGRIVEPYCVIHVKSKENSVSVVSDAALADALEKWIRGEDLNGRNKDGMYYIVMENLHRIGGIEVELVREAVLRRMLRTETDKDAASRIKALLFELSISERGRGHLPYETVQRVAGKLAKTLDGANDNDLHSEIFTNLSETISYLHSKRIAHGDPHGRNAFITDDPDRPLVLVDPNSSCWCMEPACRHFNNMQYWDSRYLKGYARPFTSERWSSPISPRR